LALIHAWAALGWGWLCAQLLLTISQPRASHRMHLLCWTLGLVVAGFGLRAVIGYATGSTALVAFP
jgi:Co/Zn/Cd efflux system component